MLKLKFLVSSQAHYGEDMQEKIDGHCKYNYVIAEMVVSIKQKDLLILSFIMVKR